MFPQKISPAEYAKTEETSRPMKLKKGGKEENEMTKRTLSLIAALAALCFSCAAAEFDAARTWYARSLEIRGVSLNASEIGLYLKMILNEDGTSMAVYGAGDANETESVPGTWHWEDGRLFIDGKEVTVNEDEGTLIFETAAGKTVLSRNAPELPGEAVPGTAAAESEEAFFGVFSPVSAFINDTPVSMTLLAMRFSGGVFPVYTVSGGKIVRTVGDGENAAVYEYVTAFDGGRLYVFETSPDGAETYMLLTADLLEDGNVVFAMTGDDGTAARVYAERMAESGR